MKQAVINAASKVARIGGATFSVDPELLRNKRSEPLGSYPSSGYTSIYLDEGGLCVTFSILYDGESYKERIYDPQVVRDFSASIGMRL